MKTKWLSLWKSVSNSHRFALELKQELLTTHFRQSYLTCTLISETLQTFYIHKQLYYTVYMKGNLWKMHYRWFWNHHVLHKERIVNVWAKKFASWSAEKFLKHKHFEKWIGLKAKRQQKMTDTFRATHFDYTVHWLGLMNTMAPLIAFLDSSRKRVLLWHFWLYRQE